MPGEDPLEQAQVWQDLINQALKRGRSERTQTYQNEALLKSIGVLVGAILTHLGLRWIRLRWRRRRLRDGLVQVPKQQLIVLGLTGLQVLAWASAAFYVCELFPPAA